MKNKLRISTVQFFTAMLMVTNPAIAVVQPYYKVLENTGVGFSVGNLYSTVQSGNEYKFDNGSLCLDYFNLLSAGEIQTKIDIDREALVETRDSDVLNCVVTYKDGQDSTMSLVVTIEIEDLNDVVPTLFGLQHPVQNQTIYENLAIGQVIRYLMPYDLDKGLNGTVNYTIINGNELKFFELRSPTLDGDASPDRLLYLLKPLDYEQTPLFNLTFQITDKGVNPLMSYQQLLIHVADVNDQIPIFNSPSFHFNVAETAPIGNEYPFGRVNATDEDSATHAQIFYRLSQSSLEFSDLFDVNATTGSLSLLRSIDYDSNEPVEYAFSVEARNPESIGGTNAKITVTITDVNDELPSLLNTPTNIEEISENIMPELIVVTYQDKDEHSPNNEIVNVSVSFSPAVSYLQPSISMFSELYFVTVQINETLDREETPFINLTIFVTDNGIPSQTSETTFTITVTDKNDNAPQFNEEKFIGKISESSRPNRYVLTVTAFDMDNGSNGTFHFDIIETTPSIAQGWFSINSTTGDIHLINEVDYYAVNGRVELLVSATDHGNDSNTNTTIVEISILPSITFPPNSFQEYSIIDLIDSSIIYLEMRTDRNDTNALLMYQYSDSITSLQLIDNRLVYSSDNTMIEKNVTFNQNKWYSILIDKNDLTNSIKVWERGQTNNNEATELLQTSVLTRCADQQTKSNTPLYIGGIDNIFSIPEEAYIRSYDFNGEISAIIIDNTQLDTSCPFQYNGVLDGSHLTHLCTPLTNPCNTEYSSCVSYTASGNNCQCKSGFPYDSCDDLEDFGPISLTEGSHVEFDLDYNYFFNTQLFSTNTQNISISIISATESTVGVLFYSKTDDSIQRLEIDQTIRYTVTTTDYTLILSLITERVTIIPKVEYTLRLEILNDETLGRIAFGETGKELQYLTLNNHLFGSKMAPYLFAKQSSTRVSIGGISDNGLTTVKGDFNGCITNFSINQYKIPLNNFIRTGYQNLSIYGDHDNVSLSCHHCLTENACPKYSECEITGTLRQNEHYCRCIPNYEMRNGMCYNTIIPTSMTPSLTLIATPTRPPTDGIENPTTTSKMSLNIIISIAGCTLFAIGIAMVLLIVIVRCAYVRGKRKHGFQFVTKVTYHQNGITTNDTNETDETFFSPAKVSNNYVRTAIRHTRRFSSSDNDSAIDGPHSPCSFRKSTSHETGFHTASELDTPSRQSSPRRVYDCGKSSSEQYDSDLETDSESLNTSGIEECLSPRNFRLLNSSIPPPGMGDYRKEHRVSSKERIILTPLHPNSSYLLTEDESQSEVSIATNTTNRQLCIDNDSIISDANGPKWYKSSSPSTIVSNDMPTHYISHTLDSYKRSKHRMPPANFRPHKSNSPPHYYVNHSGHSPLSSSPLVQKAHRFDYPPYSSSPTSSNRVFHYTEPIDHPLIIPHLPAIDESNQYIHRLPYHIKQHSDHSFINVPPQLHHNMNPAPYYPGYQGTNLTPSGMNLTPGGVNLTPGDDTGSTKYRDLNSFAQVNPITYWEQQQRLHPNVDDGLNFLTEAYTKFEDVSTTPSVVESTLIDDGDESVITGSEFGSLRRPITSRGVHNNYFQMPMFSKLPRSRRNSEREESVHMTGRESSQEDVPSYPITHFPSADCCTPTFINDEDINKDHMLESTSTLAASDNTPPQ